MPGTNAQPEMLLPPTSIDPREATGLDAEPIEDLQVRRSTIVAERVRLMLDWEQKGFALTDVEDALRRRGVAVRRGH